MAPLQKSGLYYPNKFGMITIKSLEEVMGKNGLNAILNLAGMNNYIENYPPDNLDKGFDFAELSAIGSALEAAPRSPAPATVSINSGPAQELIAVVMPAISSSSSGHALAWAMILPPM